MAGPDEAPVFSYTELLGLVDDPYAATDFRRLTGDGVATVEGPGGRTFLEVDPEAIRLFMELLIRHGNPERALRRMNELGVLAAFIPEFEPVVAMMQFNHYHHYTVDEHSIQCVAALAEIERGDLEGYQAEIDQALERLDTGIAEVA